MLAWVVEGQRQRQGQWHRQGQRPKGQQPQFIALFSLSLQAQENLQMAPTAFPLEAVRSGTVWAGPGRASTLLLSGARAEAWALAAVPLEAFNRAILVSDFITVPACHGACHALAGMLLCIAPDGEREGVEIEKRAGREGEKVREEGRWACGGRNSCN